MATIQGVPKKGLELKVRGAAGSNRSFEYQSANSVYIYHGEDVKTGQEQFEIYSKNPEGVFVPVPVKVYGFARVSDPVAMHLSSEYNKLRRTKEVTMESLLKLLQEAREENYQGPNSRLFLVIEYSGEKGEYAGKIGAKLSSHLDVPKTESPEKEEKIYFKEVKDKEIKDGKFELNLNPGKKPNKFSKTGRKK